ncbi:hypothetical protein JYA63_00625, partial [Fictibacillus nanhaiensis]|nr:hypothetical protein [Fictibacillus nanhaiensis]
GTPPAFILSQDQTLHKSVCLALVLKLTELILNSLPISFVQFSKNCVFCVSLVLATLLGYHLKNKMSTCFFIMFPDCNNVSVCRSDKK